ncbi:MAG TPA: lytic murein transglycosylase [Acidimicrobiales bacterium]|nr:lytic murein transglycosylase [Acidimicrobiales bacterium]
MPRRLLLAALAVALVAGVAFGTNTDEPGVATSTLSQGMSRTPRQRPPVAVSPGAAEEAPPATTPSAPEEGQETPVTAAPGVDLAAIPMAAGDPAGLAEQIHIAERVIRSPSPTTKELAYYGHLQQVAYRALTDRPEWDAAVTAALPEDLRPILAANVAAGRELAQPHARPQTKMPAWRIVEPPPAAELRAYYEEGEATFGVPWEYLAAVNLTETRMGRIRGTSSAGAQGPMQFIPSTWAAYGSGDINNPRDAILSAARYLAANGGGSGNLANALYRYNPVQWYVNAVTAYAEQMVADERAYLGYHAWQVYYATELGDVLLPVGYEATERRPVTPNDLAG